jgi:hypothetical protein
MRKGSAPIVPGVRRKGLAQNQILKFVKNHPPGTNCLK